MKNFFGPRRNESTGADKDVLAAAPVSEKITRNGNSGNENNTMVNDDAMAIEGNEEDCVEVISNPLVTAIDSMDVVANLDFDKEDAVRKNSDDGPNDSLPDISKSILRLFRSK